MKNLAVLFFLMFLLLNRDLSSIQAQTKALLQLKWTGVTNSVELGLIDKITFADNNLVMYYKAGSTETVEMLTIRKFAFGTTTGFFKGEKSAVKTSFFVNPANTLVLDNLPEGTHSIAIYSIAGVLMQRVEVCPNSTSVDLLHLDRGIYFIQVNNQLIKFVRS